MLYKHYRQRVNNKPKYSRQTCSHCSLSFHLFFIGKWRVSEINIVTMWNTSRWTYIQVNLQTYHTAICLRCQFRQLVEEVRFDLVSPAGKGPNVLVAMVYCCVDKSNAKKCSHNWRMGGWTGCESDPESAQSSPQPRAALLSLPTHWRSCTPSAPPGFLKLCFSPFKTFVSYGGAGTTEWGMLRGASESLPARLAGWGVTVSATSWEWKCPTETT